ncbi:MAG: RNA polymerase sigma factor [Thermoguttaceae bacterium]|jgi:RNA polymerase sigma-70 factor (ECF subfamily)|nr:RNA polymerase sigma factor [Thermoguttaceae bacterium]
MMIPSETDRLLVERIRAGEERAWEQLIAQYEGRLLAFVESRLRDRASAEDVVQETFVGFLTSLPNYDRRRPLEGYLFSIAAHKLTDRLRREGRRPALPLAATGSSGGWEPAACARAASSLVRSGERRGLEDAALAAAIRQQIDHWRRRGQWEKLRCAELLFVRGRSNKQAAEQLGISEQTVANYKHEFLGKLQGAVRKQRLPEDVFPELY